MKIVSWEKNVKWKIMILVNQLTLMKDSPGQPAECQESTKSKVNIVDEKKYLCNYFNFHMETFESSANISKKNKKNPVSIRFKNIYSSIIIFNLQ